MTKKIYELTEGEWTIIGAVWDNERCATPTIHLEPTTLLEVKEKDEHVIISLE